MMQLYRKSHVLWKMITLIQSVLLFSNRILGEPKWLKDSQAFPDPTP